MRRREGRLPSFFYADNLVLYGESEEDLKRMFGRFDKVCRRRCLKVYAKKSKVIMLGGEEALECEIHVDGMHLEIVPEVKFRGCILD